MSGAQVRGGAAAAVVNFVKDDDLFGAFNDATHVFTAPVAGVYDVSVQLMLNTASDEYINLRKNGALLFATRKMINVSSGVGAIDGQWKVRLNAGDTLDVQTEGQSAGNTVSASTIYSYANFTWVAP